MPATEAHRSSVIGAPSAARGLVIASGVVCALTAFAECWHWRNPDQRFFALFGELCGEHADCLPFLPWLLLLTWSAWRIRPVDSPGPSAPTSGLVSTWIASGLVCAVALGVSLSVAAQFRTANGDPFPPAYHDEYSYLFQAQTFLAGRSWFPSFEPRPELFDQMHVLNLGRFASRYFPGVGVWLLPFVAGGNPWLGQSVAHALCAGLLVWIGRELRGNVCGVTTGLLFAVSPGLAIFSTLLVAHHPTLLGLLVFLWAFLRLMRRPDSGIALIAGTGLSYAMLCRPMTAAGFALPFGLWTARYLLTERGSSQLPMTNAESPITNPSPLSRPSPLLGDLPVVEDCLRGRGGEVVGWRTRVSVGLSLAAPLVAGIAVMCWYSWTITGDPFVSPYQLYTDEYTPRHVYGFNNVVRGKERLGPHVVENYDTWAENLTPALAARNTGRRLLASLRLTLGIVPIAFAVLFLLIRGRLRGPLALIALSIFSLFAVHVPFWFVGIMEWHYVLEAAPLWLLLVGAAGSDLRSWCIERVGRGPRLAWFGLLTTAVAVNTLSVPLSTTADGTWWLWQARLPRLMDEIGFARGKYEQVRQRITEFRHGRRAVLLVIPDPVDRSLDYVTNEPSLAADVIRVRVPAGETQPSTLQAIAELFPDRVPLLFDVAAGRLEPL